MSPTFTCVSKKVAFSAHTVRSLSAMKWRPPPTTMPLTAVMTGFQQRFWTAVSRFQGASSRASVPVGVASPEAMSARSMPVQKAFSPLPVTMAHTTSGSDVTAFQTSSSSCAIFRLRALWRSGRFSVMVATPSRLS